MMGAPFGLPLVVSKELGFVWSMKTSNTTGNAPMLSRRGLPFRRFVLLYHGVFPRFVVMTDGGAMAVCCAGVIPCVGSGIAVIGSGSGSPACGTWLMAALLVVGTAVLGEMLPGVPMVFCAF